MPWAEESQVHSLCGGKKGKMKKSSSVNECGNILLIANESDMVNKMSFTVYPNLHLLLSSNVKVNFPVPVLTHSCPKGKFAEGEDLFAASPVRNILCGEALNMHAYVHMFILGDLCLVISIPKVTDSPQTPRSYTLRVLRRKKFNQILHLLLSS